SGILVKCPIGHFTRIPLRSLGGQETQSISSRLIPGVVCVGETVIAELLPFHVFYFKSLSPLVRARTTQFQPNNGFGVSMAFRFENENEVDQKWFDRALSYRLIQ
ncbi:MAG: hypothetical protein AAFN70_13140, partial [Planctomycetota bacterium]